MQKPNTLVKEPFILFKNRDCCMAWKPGGMPTVDDPTGDLSLLKWLEGELGTNLFPIHRIDRPVSGGVLYAMNKSSAAYFSKQVKEARMKRIYLAACDKRPKENTFELRGWIHKLSGKNRSVFTEEKQGDSRTAAAEFTICNQTDNYTILAAKLESGRHHQVRAMLQHLGSPAKGDVKYGARRKNKDRSIHLHAWMTGFYLSSEETSRKFLSAPLPEDPVWNAVNIAEVERILTEKNWIEPSTKS